MKTTAWTEMHRVSIRVTAMHIAQGRYGDCYACPIALALNETLGGEWGVSNTLINDLLSGYSIGLPLIAARFISDFDRTQTVVPFCFNLELPLALVPIALRPGPFNSARKYGL